MTAGEWAGDIDTSRPSTARMYDYFLGGSHHFAADRAAAEQVISALPRVREMAVANRAFLRRAVRYLADQGITQFLDIGSGIPTAGNVHDTAPSAQVAYVDMDPVAVAHAVALLRDHPAAIAIRADLQQPATILGHPGVRAVLDLSRPVGLLLVSMLHFVPDDTGYPAVARLREALAPGSYLAVSHAATEATWNTGTKVADVYRTSDAAAALSRTREQIRDFFGDWELTPTGLVWAGQWPDPAACDDPAPEAISILAGTARKPGGASAQVEP